MNDTLGALSGAQDTVVSGALGNLDSFSVTDNITSLAKGLTLAVPLVASMMQSIYDSADGFTVIVSAAFTLTVVTMVIGIYRFYKGDD